MDSAQKANEFAEISENCTESVVRFVAAIITDLERETCNLGLRLHEAREYLNEIEARKELLEEQLHNYQRMFSGVK